MEYSRDYLVHYYEIGKKRRLTPSRLMHCQKPNPFGSLRMRGREGLPGYPTKCMQGSESQGDPKRDSIEGIPSIDLLEVDVPPIHVRVNQLHANPVAHISSFEPVD